jgi:hypothetical protein
LRKGLRKAISVLSQVVSCTTIVIVQKDHVKIAQLSLY